METPTHPLIGQLSPIFDELSISTVENVPSIIPKLEYVIEEERDTILYRNSNKSSTNLRGFPAWIEKKVEDLISRPSTQMAGVMCIKTLMRVEYTDLNEATSFFSNLLTSCVTKASSIVVAKEAASVWGLVLGNGTSTVERIVDDWLTLSVNVLLEKNILQKSAESSTGDSTGRNIFHSAQEKENGSIPNLGAISIQFAACLFLQQLVKRALRYVKKYVEIVAESLLFAIITNKMLIVRQTAADALRHALIIMYSTEDRAASEKWQQTLLSNAASGIYHQPSHIQHGALLLFNTVLSSITTCEEQISPFLLTTHSIELLEKIWLYINANLSSPSFASEVKEVLFHALPLLAQYNAKLFMEATAKELLKAAVDVFTRDSEGSDSKALMFTTIGNVVSTLEDLVPLFLNTVMTHVEVALVLYPKQNQYLEAVSCLATFAKINPKAVRPFLRQLLGPLFSVPPTIGFAKDVAKICHAFPELRSTCLSRMLDSTKKQLLDGRVKRRSSEKEDKAAHFVIDSLLVLSTLNFTGYSTLQFLCDTVVDYVSNSREDVRRCAIDLCFKLIFSGCTDSMCCQRLEGNVLVHSGRDHIRLVNIVVKKLVSAAVADAESDIRLHTLESFTTEFDHTLALQDIAISIFPALEDKHQNRIAAARLLGRLSKHNPSVIYPALRRAMLQCAIDIQYFNNSKREEQGISLLSAIAECASEMARPYISALLRNCVARLNYSPIPAPVVTALLSCVGKLARYAEDDDLAIVTQIRPTVVHHILNSSNILMKQEAIRCLCDIIRTTKEVQVYARHPELLGLLISALHGSFKETWPVRLDVLRLMGIIGAVDPVRVKDITRGNVEATSECISSFPDTRGEEGAIPIVLRNVLDVLFLPSQGSEACRCAIEVICNLLKLRESSLGCLKTYYHTIFEAILTHAQDESKDQADFIKLLTCVVSLVGNHVFLPKDLILPAVLRFLSSQDQTLLGATLDLLRELYRSLKSEFQQLLPSLLRPIINAVQSDPSKKGELVFTFFIDISRIMQDYLHNVLPCVCEVASNSSYPYNCRLASVNAIKAFANQLPNLVFHATRCVHCLCCIIKEREVSHSSLHGNSESLHSAAINCFIAIARNLGNDFEKYTPMIYHLTDAYGQENFLDIVTKAMRSDRQFSVPGEPTEEFNMDLPSTQPTSVSSRDHGDNFRYLRTTLQPRDRLTEEDWRLWLKQLPVEFLRSSPFQAHRFAVPLAQIHEPFARRMLYSTFATCFHGMTAGEQREITDFLGSVLRGKNTPSEVLQELLNLTEYMERLEMRFNSQDGKHSDEHVGLLFDLETLIDCSERCNLYSKALHYMEIQFYQLTREYERSVDIGRPEPLPHMQWEALMGVLEKSIYLCNLLGQRENANGMLTYLQLNFSRLTGRPNSQLPLMIDAPLLEKLQWWTESYYAYEKRLASEPNKIEHIAGLMRSLDNLGDYVQLLEAWKLYFPKVSKKDVHILAPYGAHAAWLMRQWSDLELIVTYMNDDGYSGTTAVFYNAALATYHRKFHEADNLIKVCRKRLDSILSGFVAESYDRAYKLFVGIQQLCELEEFAFVARNPQGLQHWQELWERRLTAMAYEGWSGTLADHTLVIPMAKEKRSWLHFAALSRVHGRETASNEIIFELLGNRTIREAFNSDESLQPAIALAAVQHLYDTQKKDYAIELLQTYLGKLENLNITQVPQSEMTDMALCHTKLAEWMITAKQGSLRQIDEIITHLKQATSLDSNNGMIWHTWARFNHELIPKRLSSFDLPTEQTEKKIICAIDGYLRSVFLANELEDILGVLSLWFKYASLISAEDKISIKKRISEVSSTVWLKVIPQIIARVFSTDAVVAESADHLLLAVAKFHPQALLYSLNVANTSSFSVSADQAERRKRAQRILSCIEELHPNERSMVAESALVCRELVRCAVLWQEIWFDELECAWPQWEKDKNAKLVAARLCPLIESMRTPETIAESHFLKDFDNLLTGAYDFITREIEVGDGQNMEQAWYNLKIAARSMKDQIGKMSSLALHIVSPKLLQNARNLLLVVPGQYREAGNFPRITAFEGTLKVMNSKQHPRCLRIDGSDGQIYKFLLKGHEDLRLDERVMQLLSFVNTLLEKHSSVQRRDCMIQVYSVTPLSDNAGLVGWVDKCDTLHQIINDYRSKKDRISEIHYMTKIWDNLSTMTLIQQIEPFEYALAKTEGNDIAHSLWMRAPSSEVWVDHRTTFVCSLATMSMVGHILGLGDRHPSNLMIDSSSGRVVHIDFGDCFEVAQHRSSFPEKVPFRLTRMLVKAMGMSGIEGLFRHGCISVMSVLRQEGSSILALLEAFVHDPLVSWWREDTDAPSASSFPRNQDTATHIPDSLIDDTNYFISSLRHLSSFRRRINLTDGADTLPSPHHQPSKAQRMVNRIKEKLEGHDFSRPGVPRRINDGLSVESQVERLIQEATSNENLCAHFIGWCPFW